MADANTVTDLKPDWPRGWSRLGAALVGLGRPLDAVAAYDKGLALDAQRHADQLRLQRVASLYEGLSPREQSMFALMLLGHGNKDIAASTGVMADTVKKHRAQVLTKMQVNSLADLLAFCKDFAPPATRA